LQAVASAIAAEADRLSCEPAVGLVPAEAYHNVMDLQFTAVFRQGPEGYIGFIEELPGANTQGATLDEARANLHEAVAMILDANRELAQQSAAKTSPQPPAGPSD
jgi:predicted RNase H-like HicB family nuclease